jgi:hypothetical protein
LSTKISFLGSDKFVPGSCVLYKTFLAKDQVSIKNQTAENELVKLASMLCLEHNIVNVMSRFGYDSIKMNIPSCAIPDPKWFPGLYQCTKEIQLPDINVIMYRTEDEEQDSISMNIINPRRIYI